jgi:hypothetical protein
MSTGSSSREPRSSRLFVGGRQKRERALDVKPTPRAGLMVGGFRQRLYAALDCTQCGLGSLVTSSHVSFGLDRIC